MGSRVEEDGKNGAAGGRLLHVVPTAEQETDLADADERARSSTAEPMGGAGRRRREDRHLRAGASVEPSDDRGVGEAHPLPEGSRDADRAVTENLPRRFTDDLLDSLGMGRVAVSCTMRSDTLEGDSCGNASVPDGPCGNGTTVEIDAEGEASDSEAWDDEDAGRSERVNHRGGDEGGKEVDALKKGGEDEPYRNGMRDGDSLTGIEALDCLSDSTRLPTPPDPHSVTRETSKGVLSGIGTEEDSEGEDPSKNEGGDNSGEPLSGVAVVPLDPPTVIGEGEYVPIRRPGAEHVPWRAPGQLPAWLRLPRPLIASVRAVSMSTFQRGGGSGSGTREVNSEPNLGMYWAELSPGERHDPIITPTSVSRIHEEDADEPRCIYRNELRLACIGILVTVVLGVGLRFGLRNAAVNVQVSAVCEHRSIWTQAGSDITHPNIMSSTKLHDNIFAFQRYFGSTVSLSDDGNRVAVSGWYAGDGVAVYQLDDTTKNWAQLGMDITLDEIIFFDKDIVLGDEIFWDETIVLDEEVVMDDAFLHLGRLASAAVLSGDGHRIAVGFPFHSGDDDGLQRKGQIKVYEHINRSWMPVGKEILGTRNNAFLGGKHSVDLSEDGSVIAIGDWRHKRNTGCVRVFKHDAGEWAQLGADIHGEFSGDWFGGSVSLSRDGMVFAAGAKYHNNKTGYVKVFQCSEGYWTQVGESVFGGPDYCEFGWPVSISADATRVAVGSYSFSGDEMNCVEFHAGQNFNETGGEVMVLEYEGGRWGGRWTQIGQGVAGDQPGDLFGFDMALSGDGTMLAVGSPGSDRSGMNAGQMNAYSYECGNWTQVGQELEGIGSDNRLGSSVSLSYNGKQMAVGAPSDYSLSTRMSGTAAVYNQS